MENNSYCSFIILRSSYSSISKLAIHMLKNRPYNKTINNKVIKIIRSSLLDNNTPISFSSDLFNTYIAIKNDNYIVTTNTETEWDLEGVLETTNEKIESKFNFWFPEYDLVGSIYKDNKDNCISCQEHKTIDFIKVKENGLIVCPVCYWNECIRFKKNCNTNDKINLLKSAMKNIDSSLLIRLIESKKGQSFWKELKFRLED